MAPYVANNTRTSKLAWPEPKLLQDLAIDNTVLVTAATCSYAPLIINWCPPDSVSKPSETLHGPPSASVTGTSGFHKAELKVWG